MNAMQTMMRLREAMRGAQERTGDKTLGMQAGPLSVKVVRVTYDRRGRSTVTPVTGFMPFDEALAHINGMGK